MTEHPAIIADIIRNADVAVQRARIIEILSLIGPAIASVLPSNITDIEVTSAICILLEMGFSKCSLGVHREFISLMLQAFDTRERS